MRNSDKLVDLMLTSENPDHASWGKQMVAARRFDFGKFDSLNKTVTPELLYACMNDRREIFRLPHGNCLFYCDEFLFIHALGCDDGVVEVRAAITDEDMEGFFLYPVYLRIDYDKNQWEYLPFLSNRKGNKKGDKRGADWLYINLAMFFVILHDYPGKVQLLDIMDRAFTREGIAVITGKPLDQIFTRAEEEQRLANVQE